MLFTALRMSIIFSHIFFCFFRVSETDKLLLHLQSFSSNSVYYNIPEGIKNGIPLYYMPPNCLNPDISMQLQHNLK